MQLLQGTFWLHTDESISLNYLWNSNNLILCGGHHFAFEEKHAQVEYMQTQQKTWVGLQTRKNWKKLDTGMK